MAAVHRTSACCLLVLLCSLLVLNVADARSGRMLQQAGERPAHEYAQSISMLASQSIIQAAVQKGATDERIKEATQVSLKNAQTSTKYWPKGTRYEDGMKMTKVDSDGDRD